MNYKKIIKYKKHFNFLNENVIMAKINERKILITDKSQIINNDDGNSHIRAYLQNLILIYTPKCTDTYELNNPLSIATQASELYNKPNQTQSAIWCPLIYNALKYAGHNIPDSWTKYNDMNQENQIKFEELSKKLAEIPLWNQYTAYILTQYTGPILNNDFDDNLMAKSNEIRDLIYL